MRAGPEEASEVNCNGHVETEQTPTSQWRDEDQHNGNAEPAEKCATPEEQRKESPVPHPMCNGVESTDFSKPDTETEDRGAHSSGVSERHFPAVLEDGELEQSILQEEGEDGHDGHYETQESMGNGQSATISAGGGLDEAV